MEREIMKACVEAKYYNTLVVSKHVLDELRCNGSIDHTNYGMMFFTKVVIVDHNEPLFRFDHIY
jgi:hypothetical protein